MDWMTELIQVGVDEGFSNSQIASAIREEIRKRRPSEPCPLYSAQDCLVWQDTVALYDKALGIGEK